MAATAERNQDRGKSSSGSGSLEVVEKPRTATVSVDDSETWVEAKRYTVYKVVVKVQGKAYFLFRRYNIAGSKSWNKPAAQLIVS